MKKCARFTDEQDKISELRKQHHGDKLFFLTTASNSISSFLKNDILSKTKLSYTVNLRLIT